MADELKTYTKCQTCNGTGLIYQYAEGEGSSVPCFNCGGDGYIESGMSEGGEQLADLTDKVNDCLDKLDDVLELIKE
jgi:DnaJ-class molecular chaperone